MTSPERPPSVRPVDYKGEPLDAERGPGLGCFRFQVVVLAVLLVLTPLTVAWNWPSEVSIALLFISLLLLLFTGQTIIFLLRLVAADRRDGRRVPLAGSTPTVGELEDAEEPAEGTHEASGAETGPYAGAGAATGPAGAGAATGPAPGAATGPYAGAGAATGPTPGAATGPAAAADAAPGAPVAGPVAGDQQPGDPGVRE